MSELGAITRIVVSFENISDHVAHDMANLVAEECVKQAQNNDGALRLDFNGASVLVSAQMSEADILEVLYEVPKQETGLPALG